MEPCPECNGDGWIIVPDHDPLGCNCLEASQYGEQPTCPIPVQVWCDFCQGTGEIELTN